MSHHTEDSSSPSSSATMQPTPQRPLSDIIRATDKAADGSECEGSCRHEKTLNTLAPDLEAMKQLITCKVCQHYMTEPFSLACGHTYCYVCLDAWLVTQKKRTCPDCRAVIKQQPIPSYVIREMTTIFSHRAELLPEGETFEEHEEFAREAAAKIARDKATTDMFSGMFKGRDRPRMGPTRDEEDRVDRCPDCHWEIEDGICSGCGYNWDEVRDHFDILYGSDDGLDGDEDEEELDLDLDQDADDGFGLDYGDGYVDGPPIARFQPGRAERRTVEALFGRPNPYGRENYFRMPHGRRTRHEPISLDSDEGGSEDEHDSEMEGFIDDEAIAEGSDGGSDNGSDSVDSDHPSRLRLRRVVIDSDDEEVEMPRARRPIIVDDDEDDSDEDDIENLDVPRGVRAIKRGRGVGHRGRPIALDSDDSESDGDESASSETDITQTGFSPLHESFSDEGEENEERDEDGVSVDDETQHLDDDESNDDDESVPEFNAPRSRYDYTDDDNDDESSSQFTQDAEPDHMAFGMLESGDDVFPDNSDYHGYGSDDDRESDGSDTA